MQTATVDIQADPDIFSDIYMPFDLAIVRVYCIFCRGHGVAEANLSIRPDRLGRRPSVCKTCWDYTKEHPKQEYWDFPRPKRYDNGEDIPDD